METKHLTTRAVLKADGDNQGTIEAVFSTFGVRDRDGDIVEPGAIENGKSVPMVWHHDWTRMIGKGVTEIDDERAVFKGSIFMDTDAGADAYRTIKAMGDLMEYSWGFRILDADFVERDAEFIRVIKRAELFEVSPVLVGAGMGTGTLSLKHGQPLHDHANALEMAVGDFVSRVRVRTDYRAKEGRTLSSANRDRLASIATALSGAAGDLSAILKDTEPAKSFDLDVLWAEHMSLTAQLNGVPLT
jgi:HK97 family phage prohead protease